MKIGERIRQARKTKGLSQTELAERVNVSQKVISRIERDENNRTDISLLNQIAEVLSVQLGDLTSDNKAIQVIINDMPGILLNGKVAADLIRKENLKDRMLEAFENMSEEGQTCAVEMIELLAKKDFTHTKSPNQK